MKLNAFIHATGHHVAAWRHRDSQADAGVGELGLEGLWTPMAWTAIRKAGRSTGEQACPGMPPPAR